MTEQYGNCLVMRLMCVWGEPYWGEICYETRRIKNIIVKLLAKGN